MTENLPQNQTRSRSTLRYPTLPPIIALVIMIIFDQIFWKKQFGIQFMLLTMLILVGLFTLVAFENVRVPWTSYILLAPIIFGSLMTIIQQANNTTFFNILLTLSGLGLLAPTLLNGQWFLYRIREVLMGGLLLIQSALIDPIRVLIEKHKSKSGLPPRENDATWKKIRPYLVGVLMAVPLLLVLGALLASADLIFRSRLTNLFDWLKIENFGEFIFRTNYIIILAYMLSGVFIHALTRSADKKSLRLDKPLFSPFLGHVEAFTILMLVNLLFLGFIVVQFRYFFAGEVNISLEGFTYAEYARRGFFELVAVAIISLGVHYLLSTFTKRTNPSIKRIFSALGLLLLLQVGTMLLSAFQRLSLYEAAYGFTTLRAITHIFIIWLGILLAAVAAMEIFNQFRRLAVTFFLIFFGFTLTLNLINVDSFIAQRNIEHAIAGYPLDANYLIRNLSNDGVPTLFDYRFSEDTPDEVKDSLEAILACRFAIRNQENDRISWAEWNLSVSRADAYYAEHQKNLETYPFIVKSESDFYQDDSPEPSDTTNVYFILVNGEELWCTSEKVQ